MSYNAGADGDIERQNEETMRKIMAQMNVPETMSYGLNKPAAGSPSMSAPKVPGPKDPNK